MLEIFDPKPLAPASPLWTTPHPAMGFDCRSDDPAIFVAGCHDLLMADVERVMAGAKSKNPVDPTLQYRR